MRFKLTAKENDNTGEVGWLDSRIRGTSAYEPLAYAYGLAHDCLEHTAFGSVADEIEAHGAMYWIRYEGGWSHPENGFTLDVGAFASEWINLYNGLQQEPYLPNPRNTRSLEETIEDDISSIIEQGRATIRREYEDANADDIQRIADVFRAYFRTGYRNAVRRYKGQHACEIAALYNVLAQAFERHRPEYEGQEIAVSVNIKTGRVSIAEVYEEAY